jgi:hypothetical protein
MTSFFLEKTLSVSVRVYRTLLAAYPKKFREHYETQMVQVFRNSVKDAYQHGISDLIDLWLHTCTDLLVTALIERLEERSQYMFSQRIVFGGGLVSAFGGLMWFVSLLAWESGYTELLLSVALLLTVGGVAALHTRQGKQAGVLGWLGFVLGILGTILALSGLLGILGYNLLGLGYILIGFRAWQTRDLPRWRLMPLALGIMLIGFVFSARLEQQISISGIDPWNPLTVPAIALVFLSFSIGILWMVLGGILAKNPGRQNSNQPQTSP